MSNYAKQTERTKLTRCTLFDKCSQTKQTEDWSKLKKEANHLYQCVVSFHNERTV